ncbi:hypothetical protein Tco_1114507 [Tanacetum coccineum]|uniref:Uncharacterized protein n=1 Tax=Tanacetum coccineum TaxID=301880 RepID=A0ABQ5IYY8_9ASTR
MNIILCSSLIDDALGELEFLRIDFNIDAASAAAIAITKMEKIAPFNFTKSSRRLLLLEVVLSSNKEAKAFWFVRGLVIESPLEADDLIGMELLIQAAVDENNGIWYDNRSTARMFNAAYRRSFLPLVTTAWFKGKLKLLDSNLLKL